ncbi:MAG: hypothetical protein LBI18_12975 [Planctomycetaceae bacterium]|nr:hypothetical protein [Planctomycetaceae bacterium]
MNFRQKTTRVFAGFNNDFFHLDQWLWFRCCIISLFCVVFLFITEGCSRQHYRIKADSEVYSLLATGGTHDPRWQLDDYRINTDCRSRMFDPFHPDFEPMPADDPAAHHKMHVVDGKNASKHWHDKGMTRNFENPNWQQYLLFNEKGAVPLDKDGAVELALLHSPEYQAALENLYLAAMRVSRERFRFDVQFYGGDSLFYTANGRLRDNGNTNLRNDVNIDAGKTGAEILFATGGELVVGLANSITWSFNGTNTWYADSLFNVGLVQPILRNAGKKIVLENLTQAERDFLAAIRQMVFFQQGYYTKIVTGVGQQSAPVGNINAANTPTLNNGFYGLLAEQIRIQNQRQNIIALEDNLQRFIEVFDAGQLTDISQVEETRQRLLNSESSLLQRIITNQGNIDTYIRSLGLPPDLRVEISDPLMEQFQLTSPTLTNLQEDLGDLLVHVRTKEKPLPDDFGENLEKVIQRTEGEIQNLYNDLEVLQKSVPDRLESLQHLALNLSDRLQQGERIDSSIYDTDIFQTRIEKLQNETVPENIHRMNAAFKLLEQIIQLDESVLRQMIRNNSFEPEVREALEILKLSEVVLPDAKEMLLEHQQELEKSREFLEALKEVAEKRRSETIVRAEPDAPAVELRTPNNPNDNPLVPKVLRNDTVAAETWENGEGVSFKEIGNLLNGNPLNSNPLNRGVKRDRTESQRIVSELRQKDEYRDWIRRVLSAFQYELVSLSLIQTRTRLDAITLVPTSISPEDAFGIASENRLDWMNRRAMLVDTWRQIDLAANQLKGDLNLTLDGEIGTIDRRGVRFDGDDGRLRVGLNWDSPLTRHNEMLDYRRTQIEYQAARRDYYTYVDSVNAELRRVLRNTQLNQIDFEIARNAVLIATSRVDVWQLKMEQPPARGQKIETTTATQLIGALDGLMTSQNEFLNTWVSYQTQRMLLDLTMGTMELDRLGRWIDPGVITKDRARSTSKSVQSVQQLTPKPLTPKRRHLHQRQQPTHLVQRQLSDPLVPSAPRLERETVTPEDLEISERSNSSKPLEISEISESPKEKSIISSQLIQSEPNLERAILQTSWNGESLESQPVAPLPP